MSVNVNTVAISGNLTRDSRYTANAADVEALSFTVAVGYQKKNPQTGTYEDGTHFVDCVLFGKRAGSLSHYLVKGTKVAVNGSLRYASWVTEDGQRRSKLEVQVSEVDFMSPRVSVSTPVTIPPSYAAPQPPAMPPAAPAVPSATSADGAYSQLELADEDIQF